jgi:hypothetical protein
MHVPVDFPLLDRAHQYYESVSLHMAIYENMLISLA